MSRYDYEFERVNDYCYPDSYVLRNRFDIRDAETLNTAEREFVSAKLAHIKGNPIKGKFDLNHLCSRHRYLFCDIYDWAGELRTVNIAKGNQFCNYIHLGTYAEGVFAKLKAEKRLSDTSPDAIPERLAYYLSEINVLHPFREGNGRTQRVFIEYLAQVAGWHTDFSDVSDREMIEASALAFALEYDMLITMLRRIVTPITPEEQRVFRVKLGLSRPARST
jgi:cell filamentation protein